MTDNPIRSPWLLVDALTVEQAADIFERLTTWLTSADRHQTANCARALSRGETDDPETIASWTDAVAAHLRHLTDQATIESTTPHDQNN